MERLTDEQSDEVARRYDEARAMARRFRPPAGMTADEWEAEVLFVLVRLVPLRPAHFEAFLYRRTRWAWLNLDQGARRQPDQIDGWGQIPARQAEPATTLGDVLHGLSPEQSDVVHLRLAGGTWPTIGRLYGVSGRTIQRRHRAVLKRLRAREAARLRREGPEIAI